ncbi:MAG: hypothetical protein JEY96_18480 [Bacteroidales bacterium]|jgi:hypothetical protein|nr:hypothetical protein [Bacteroidales bacterium]
MSVKKQNNFQSPDLNLLQGVVVDYKTTIYISKGADPVKAKSRYLERINAKYVKS